ncbi:MAG: hypothetical protein JWP03_2937 [Phycisphaerales bacterium]|jgi:hypothetical protein|nr:hypothetical protein [Phycisphaerales bacterium]
MKTTRKIAHKPYDRMTTAELREATKQFDEPFVALRNSRPLTSRQKQIHRSAKNRGGRPQIGKGAKVISVSVERGLLDRADDFAKKTGLTRAQLVARGLEMALEA